MVEMIKEEEHIIILVYIHIKNIIVYVLLNTGINNIKKMIININTYLL
jgi:hypothetical protein